MPSGFVPPTDPTAEASPAEFTVVGTVVLVGEGEAPLQRVSGARIDAKALATCIILPDHVLLW